MSNFTITPPEEDHLDYTESQVDSPVGTVVLEPHPPGFDPTVDLNLHSEEAFL